MSRPTFAAVAVPVPLPTALTYSVPETLASLTAPGVRVRVRLGKRRVTGVVIALPEKPPEGVTLKPLDEVLDPVPLLPPDLLALARFTAEYYLAPPGEVLRAVLPPDLPAWGDRRVSLTDAGALAPPRAEDERRVTETLSARGGLRAAQLQQILGLDDPAGVLEALGRSGRVRIREPRERSGRFSSAYELPPGDLIAQLEACGRSAPGRAAVEYMAALGRPASAEELTQEVGCTKAVLRRLVGLGVLRHFTQLERLPLGRHVLGGREERAFTLRPDQQEASDALVGAIAAGGFSPFLLRGITGSGKTEVYLDAVEAALEAGGSAILLVPEIAMVPALARSVARRFPQELAILHSNLGPAERQQEWERIRGGEGRVVLGPRSALFAPVSSLKLVVVDEEHDPAYKQDVTPRYQGRDLAMVRGRSAGAAVVLVSATPSLESRLNAETGKYRRLELTERAGQGELPEGVLVDLRKEGVPKKPGEVRFSRRLCTEIENALAVGSQVILLRNRRGYSPLLLCRACGEDQRCEECGLPRTYHRKEGRLLCHYCGSTRPVPQVCPACEEDALEAIGAGTERVEETFRELFPDVPAGVLDRDVVRRRGGAAAVLERFANGETKVLIGTQMVSKGHHFPNVALTAVLAADTYLRFPDFRAVERTYSLLTQVAGRAGRGEVPGRVVLQTFYPEHYAIRAVLGHDDEGFAREEMRFRRMFHYPPYTRMVQLLLRDSNRARGKERIHEIAAGIHRHPLSRGVRVSGPAPAPLVRLRGKWRFQILVRAESGRQLRDLVRAVVPEQPDSDLTVDVDPHDLL